MATGCYNLRVEGQEFGVLSIREPPSPEVDKESEEFLFEVIVPGCRWRASLVGEGDTKGGESAPLAANFSLPNEGEGGGEGGVGEGSTLPMPLPLSLSLPRRWTQTTAGVDSDPYGWPRSAVSHLVETKSRIPHGLPTGAGQHFCGSFWGSMLHFRQYTLKTH